MAFQPETATYDAGVLQLETTTPVQGGVGGASNTPLLQLADRCMYLKQHMDALEASITGYAPLNSANLTGTPTAPTPAQFDNSTKLATTAFVQRASGNFSSAVVYNAAATLTVADCGRSIRLGGAGYNMTLPLASAVAVGSAIWMQHSGTVGSPINVVTQGGDIIDYGEANVSTYPLNLGEDVVLVCVGVGAWGAVSGLGNMKYVLKALIASPGYQKYASGLIMQWGTVSVGAGATTASASFAVTFPTSAFFGYLTSPNVNTIVTTTGLTTAAISIASSQVGPFGVPYLAFGY